MYWSTTLLYMYTHTYMNMLYSCVLYLDAGGQSRDMSLVLYVTLCLL